MSDQVIETTTGRREIAEKLRLAFLGGKNSPDLMADLFAADAVYETRYAFPGAPTVFEGREAIRAHLRAYQDSGAPNAFDFREAKVDYHEGAGQELFTIEVELAGFTVPAGVPFRFQSAVGIITARHGKIVSYRDYPNAIGGAAAVGQLKQLGEALIAASGN